MALCTLCLSLLSSFCCLWLPISALPGQLRGLQTSGSYDMIFCLPCLVCRGWFPVPHSAFFVHSRACAYFCPAVLKLCSAYMRCVLPLGPCLVLRPDPAALSPPRGRNGLPAPLHICRLGVLELDSVRCSVFLLSAFNISPSSLPLSDSCAS